MSKKILTDLTYVPSRDLFMSGGNTDDEKAWFELGYKSAKKEMPGTQLAKEYAVRLLRGFVNAYDTLKYDINPELVERTKKFIAENPSVRDGAA